MHVPTTGIDLSTPVVMNGPQDPKVHMLHIRRSSIPVSRGNQDQGRINLLRLSKERLKGEGLPHSLGKLLELPLVHFLVKVLRSTKLGGHAEQAQGTQGSLEGTSKGHKDPKWLHIHHEAQG